MATDVVPTIDESRVRAAIDGLIAHKEKLMNETEDTNAIEYLRYLGAGIDTLIQLKHELRLCDCPPEVYEKAGEG